ncbi:MAG: tripartite tricarboxylate transporter substrate binding protein [Alcaligenaceae bacterium]
MSAASQDMNPDRRLSSTRRFRQTLNISRVYAIAICVVVNLCAALAWQVQAQGYPTRPIRMIVPFAAGSATDTVARVYGQKMSESLGQPVVVENRTGAVGTIAADLVAKAAPDGYTILVGTNTTNAAVMSLMKNVPYDPARDFTSISFLGNLPQVLIINTSLPFKTVEEFLTEARRNPEKLTYAWTNSVSRVAAELLAGMSGVKFFNVPYKTGSGAIADVISGQVNFTIVDMIVAYPQIQSGKVRALAVTSAQRIELLPDTPSISEAAKLPGYELMGIFAAFGPANLPDDILAKLNTAIVKAGKDPELIARFKTMSLNVETGSSQQLEQRFAKEREVWSRVAREAGIKPE